MIEFGRAMGTIALVAHGRFAELDEDVRLVPGAFQNVISALGSAVGMDLRFEAPTLWGPPPSLVMKLSGCLTRMPELSLGLILSTV
jgi:hypothetical protein